MLGSVENSQLKMFIFVYLPPPLPKSLAVRNDNFTLLSIQSSPFPSPPNSLFTVKKSLKTTSNKNKHIQLIKKKKKIVLPN